MNFGQVCYLELSSAVVLLTLEVKDLPYLVLPDFLEVDVNSARDPGDPEESRLLACWLGNPSFGAVFLKKLGQLTYQVVRRLNFCFWLHEGLGVATNDAGLAKSSHHPDFSFFI